MCRHEVLCPGRLNELKNTVKRRNTLVWLGQRHKPQLSNTLLSVQACPEDALNEILNELKFSFEGLPSRSNLRPSLDPQEQTTSIHPVSVFSELTQHSRIKKAPVL